MTTEIKINYKEYPECMFAIVAAFLPDYEGDDLRRAACKVVFRHEDKEGNTYRNGLLHSYDDKPAMRTNNIQKWYKNGLRHREIADGPAVIDNELGVEEWWVDGEYLYSVRE